LSILQKNLKYVVTVLFFLSLLFGHHVSPCENTTPLRAPTLAVDVQQSRSLLSSRQRAQAVELAAEGGGLPGEVHMGADVEADVEADKKGDGEADMEAVVEAGPGEE
jgi:hypothetical protein